jgi:hypothetical protein
VRERHTGRDRQRQRKRGHRRVLTDLHFVEITGVWTQNLMLAKASSLILEPCMSPWLTPKKFVFSVYTQTNTDNNWWSSIRILAKHLQAFGAWYLPNIVRLHYWLHTGQKLLWRYQLCWCLSMTYTLKKAQIHPLMYWKKLFRISPKTFFLFIYILCWLCTNSKITLMNTFKVLMILWFHLILHSRKTICGFANYPSVYPHTYMCMFICMHTNVHSKTS